LKYFGRGPYRQVTREQKVPPSNLKRLRQYIHNYFASSNLCATSHIPLWTRALQPALHLSFEPKAVLPAGKFSSCVVGTQSVPDDCVVLISRRPLTPCVNTHADVGDGRPETGFKCRAETLLKGNLVRDSKDEVTHVDCLPHRSSEDRYFKQANVRFLSTSG